MSNKPRVRFAPSPTGHFHVGGARTALYDYLYAHRHGGQFVLRIEDTDQERSTEESLKALLKDLEWLGLRWDEGIKPGTTESFGPHSPYRQSERLSIYNEYAERLIDSGQAFYCFMSEEEQSQLREQAVAAGKPGQIKSPYRNETLATAKKRISEGEKPVIRFRTPDEEKIYKIQDLVRGEVEFPSHMVGDFVLVRSDGMPVYNFCCVLDDALMKITHVFRAEEHLSNTLRQLMLYEALGFVPPQFGHVSLILGADKQKLSKRHGATSVNQYRELGYLPEAMNNFLALLGWSSPSGEEILSMGQMIREFSTDRLNSSPAVFDETKLKWVNACHLRAMDHKKLWSLIQPYLTGAGLDLPADVSWQDRSLQVFKTYMETLADAIELYRPLANNAFKLAEEAQEVLQWPETRAVIAKWQDLLKNLPQDYLSEEEFNQLQNQVKEVCGVKGKHLFMPIRTAIIGKPHGAELKILVPLLTRQTLIERAQQVLQNCKEQT